MMRTGGMLVRRVVFWMLPAAVVLVVEAKNPFIHSIYTADPSARVWDDGRIYVYASRDIDPNRGCDLMDRPHVFSSHDLVTWVDEGEILRSSQVLWGRPEGGFMWAPDCAFKNGTYYYYFPHPSATDWGSSWKIGVATSSRPASDFVVQGYIEGLDPLIDPAVFIDDDGQAYLYHGGGGVCKGGRLRENMVEIDGAMENMTGLHDFHEAAWVHKHNGLYYLSYADNHSDSTGDNRMCYATGSTPLGPWTYRGIIMHPTDSYCAHGSIVEFRGQWYVFYFTSAISGNDWLRSICVDRLEYNEDGTIRTVVQTSSGVAPVADPLPPLTPITRFEAESGECAGGAVTGTHTAASGGGVVQNLHVSGAYAEYHAVDGGSGGRATINIHYAANEHARLHLEINGEDFALINALPTGSWDTYTGQSCLTVPLLAGPTNTIRFTGGRGGVNIDYITITSVERASTARQARTSSGTHASPKIGIAALTSRTISCHIGLDPSAVARVAITLFDLCGRRIGQVTSRAPLGGGRTVFALENGGLRAGTTCLAVLEVVAHDGRPHQVNSHRVVMP